MIFADKLIKLRKQAGWSQEELAAHLDVSRQSVSKWESAQSIPDLEKIIKLSKLFGVSTDYLVKDEIDDEIYLDEQEEDLSFRKVSMNEANEFIKVKTETAPFIAYGVFLCIISPICLLMLGGLSEYGKYGISENVAGAIGIVILLILVTIAVTLFIYSRSKTSSFDYLENEIFETEYGVIGMVKERRALYQDYYTRNNIIGVALCIMAMIPFFTGIMINENDEIMLIALLCLALVLVGIGVIRFVKVGIVWASFEKLLQEGDYSRTKKEKNPLMAAITVVYWLSVTAIFLAVSLPSRNWRETWIIWVIAAVLFPALIAIVNLFSGKKK